MPETQQNGGIVPTTVSARLEDGDSADEFRDRQIGVLMAHMRHTAAQVAEITVTQRRVDAHMGQLSGEIRELSRAFREHAAASAERASKLEAKVDTNTAITEDIAKLKTTGKTIRNVIVWLGGLGAGIVGIWQLVTTIKGGGGVGPAP